MVRPWGCSAAALVTLPLDLRTCAPVAQTAGGLKHVLSDTLNLRWGIASSWAEQSAAAWL
eukprot:2112057-Alexandrium_andersonii.AAC.1